MKNYVRIGVALVALFVWSGYASGVGPTSDAQGILRFDPPQSVSLVAVRVEVPEGQVAVGLRWYNGDSDAEFSKILVGTGSDYRPPAYSEAVQVATDVAGEYDGWSEIEFENPVASLSGAVFVFMQYPSSYEPQAGQLPLGVGFTEGTSRDVYFVSGDGERWIEVARQYQLLLKPILEDGQPGGVVLKSSGRRSADLVQVPFGLAAAPNPFNPETEITLSLPRAATGTVRVYDVRGALVSELHSGYLAAGHSSFTWKGCDGSGRTVASGVYWVKLQTEDRALTEKLLLLK